MNTFKHVGIMLVASFLAVLIIRPIAYLLNAVGMIYSTIYGLLARIITFNVFNYDVRQLVMLVLFSLLLALIPAGIYTIIKKRSYKHFMLIAWFAWTVLVVMLAIAKS